jgi:hypothetical protein
MSQSLVRVEAVDSLHFNSIPIRNSGLRGEMQVDKRDSQPSPWIVWQMIAIYEVDPVVHSLANAAVRKWGSTV